MNRSQAAMNLRNDARVRFADDGPDGPTFVRYNDTLMTWQDFLDTCYGEGLSQEFVIEYVNALGLEEV
jgi:hypothetical protein